MKNKIAESTKEHPSLEGMEVNRYTQAARYFTTALIGDMPYQNEIKYRLRRIFLLSASRTYMDIRKYQSVLVTMCSLKEQRNELNAIKTSIVHDDVSWSDLLDIHADKTVIKEFDIVSQLKEYNSFSPIFNLNKEHYWDTVVISYVAGALELVTSMLEMMHVNLTLEEIHSQLDRQFTNIADYIDKEVQKGNGSILDIDINQRKLDAFSRWHADPLGG